MRDEAKNRREGTPNLGGAFPWPMIDCATGSSALLGAPCQVRHARVRQLEKHITFDNKARGL